MAIHCDTLQKWSGRTVQKRTSDPRPPHTRQEYEHISGQNMAQNASKQGIFDSYGAIFLFMFLSCMCGLGSQNESPTAAKKCMSQQRGSSSLSHD